MASITFALDTELKSRLEKFPWVNWSELAREELLKKTQILDRLKSREEKELTKWSVELARRDRKEAWQKFAGKR
ncbi:MAG: hypothetical protein V1837_04770 [Candidatus Woesearchaeota archaeon]